MRKLTFLAVLSLAVISCGSEEPAATTPADEPVATTVDHSQHETTTSDVTGDTSAADSSGEPTIEISGFAFSGPTTVSVGDTIRIVNNDSAPHTWSAEDGPFDVSVGPGETATYTFEEAGQFDYFCRIHPSMKGAITVEG
ncbi:MAG TPA: cupredoxin domain-containing protein [Acidimicrobiia bacterium]|nr:cupredoxin domain-containing protein [Acidimicrobiia bacterium]